MVAELLWGLLLSLGSFFMSFLSGRSRPANRSWAEERVGPQASSTHDVLGNFQSFTAWSEDIKLEMSCDNPSLYGLLGSLAFSMQPIEEGSVQTSFLGRTLERNLLFRPVWSSQHDLEEMDGAQESTFHLVNGITDLDGMDDLTYPTIQMVGTAIVPSQRQPTVMVAITTFEPTNFEYKYSPLVSQVHVRTKKKDKKEPDFDDWDPSSRRCFDNHCLYAVLMAHLNQGPPTLQQVLELRTMLAKAWLLEPEMLATCASFESVSQKHYLQKYVHTGWGGIPEVWLRLRRQC